MASLDVDSSVRMTSPLQSYSLLTGGSATKRGPKTTFEKENEAAGDSLSRVGISKQVFQRIMKDFNLPRSLLHGILVTDQSLYSSQHQETGVSEYTYASKTSQCEFLPFADKKQV